MYTIVIEKFRDAWETSLKELMTIHYAEMEKRLLSEGINCSPFNPRLNAYFEAGDEGYLLSYILRLDDKSIGYCNLYLTQDMHNSDLIAEEDALFVLEGYRNGIGRRLSKFILDDLRSRGVKRFCVSARTDPRATKLWARLGFKPSATQMQYDF